MRSAGARVAIAAAVVTLALGGAAHAAHGRTLVFDTGQGYPILAGDGIVWVARSFDRDGELRSEHLRLMRRDGSRVTLRQFDGLLGHGGYYDDRYLSLAASATHLVVGVDEAVYDGEPEPEYYPSFAELRAGPFDGPAVRLRLCRQGEELTQSPSIHGSVVGWLDAACDKTRATIQVRDLRTGTGRRLTPRPGLAFDDVKVAGRYVLGHETRTPGAQSPGEAVVLFDRRSGRQLLRFAGEDGRGPEQVMYDVTPGGMVAVSYDSDGAEDPGCDFADTIAILSVRDPEPRAAGVRPCSGPPRLVRGWLVYDRLAYLGPPPGQVSGPSDEAVALRELVARHLATGREKVLTEATTNGAGIEVQGGTVLLATQACDLEVARFSLLSWAALLDGPPVRSERCVVRLRGPDRLDVGDRGELETRVACPRGCYGQLRLWLPSEQRHVRLLYNGSVSDAATVLLERRTKGEPVTPQLTDPDREALNAAGGWRAEWQIAVRNPNGTTRTARRAVELAP